ncbi:MAG TPA: histidine phosphatase family protein [Caulobacteraceae bacterium]
MRRLILFRHAKTEARAPTGDDLSRRLTERGRGDAELMGHVLTDAGYTPDLALVSPAVRSRETWDKVAARFPKARVELRKGLYDATPEEIADELAVQVENADTVIVVAHNPGLQELGINLLIESDAAHRDIERLSAGFPTASAAVFAMDPEGRGRLEALLHARDHREGA